MSFLYQFGPKLGPIWKNHEKNMMIFVGFFECFLRDIARKKMRVCALTINILRPVGE